MEQLVNMQEKTVRCISYFKQGRLRLKSWMAAAAVYYCYCHYYHCNIISKQLTFMHPT